MLAEYFNAGGPVMYAVLVAWIVVLAAVLDRMLYAFGRVARRPRSVILGLVHERRLLDARALYRREQGRAERGLQRIDAVSQVATSIGLFGTVLGIAQSFFARGLDAGPAAPEVLSSGLSTALFTTIAGLVVFLFGQGFLIVFGEWRAFCDRDLDDRLEMEGER